MLQKYIGDYIFILKYFLFFNKKSVMTIEIA